MVKKPKTKRKRLMTWKISAATVKNVNFVKVVVVILFLGAERGQRYLTLELISKDIERDFDSK